MESCAWIAYLDLKIFWIVIDNKTFDEAEHCQYKLLLKKIN